MNPTSPKTPTPQPKTVSLVEEILSTLKEIPNKGSFLLLLLPWFALFHFLGNSTFGYMDTPSLFEWTWGAYNVANSEDGHGNLIPFVVLALLWLKRDKIRSVSGGQWAPALVLVGLGLTLHGIGYIIQQPRLSIVAFFLGLYGLAGQIWGLALMKAILFPFVLFAFSVPLGSLADNITVPLRMVVSQLAVGISHWVLGIDVIREGSQIFDTHHTFRYDVAPACSGIRSLISLVVLSTIYGALTFRTIWKRWLIVGLAIPFAVAGNVLRIMGVIVAAEAFGQNAGEVVEQKLGFLTFALAIGLMLLSSRILRDPDPSLAAPPGGKGQSLGKQTNHEQSAPETA